MILRIVVNAVGVALIAAAVGALIDPGIVRAAVAHISGGLYELVDIGERLGQSPAGQQIAGRLSELAGRATQ